MGEDGGVVGEVGDVSAARRDLGVSIMAPRYRRLTVGIVLTVTFFAFEELALATALPVVLRHLGHIRLYGWAFSAFMLGSLVSIVVAGSLTDRGGMAPSMSAGVAAFVAGLVVCGAAPTMLIVVIGRAVQGVGAGLLTVVVNVAVGRGYPSELRARVYAALSTAWILPAVIGPVVAGVVAQEVSWRAVFLGVVPLTLAAAAIAVPAVAHTDRALQHARAETMKDDEAVGHNAPTLGEGALGDGAPGDGAVPGDGAPGDGAVPGDGAALGEQATGRATGLARGLALAGGSALFLAALSTRQPVLAPLLGIAGLALAIPAIAGVLSSANRLASTADTPASRRARTGAIVVSGLFAMSFFGTEAFLPLALVSVHRRTATEAGLALTTAAITWTVASWAQARWQDPVGPRRLVRIGLVFVALGVATVLAVDWAATPWWFAFVGWGIGGFGMGLSYATASVVVLDHAPPDEQGAPVAAQQVFITLGVALGAGLGGAAVAWSSVLGSGHAPGLRVFDLFSVGVALVGVAVAGLLPRRAGAPASFAPTAT
jgi:MFS family permease